MAYTKTNWQANVTPLSEANMDHLETQYDELISLFDAHSILMAIADNDPAALTIAASRIVGRKAAGNIVALTGAEVLTIIGRIGKSNLEWTANKLLKGAGAGSDPTEINPPTFFTQLAGGEAHPIGGAGAWEDWDISGIVPAGTQYVLICVECRYAYAGTTTVGTRKNGTALDRKQTFAGAAIANLGSVEFSYNVLSEVDASRILEIYASSTDELFNVLGYWS